MTISQWLPQEARDVWTLEFPPCLICGEPSDYCEHGMEMAE